MPITVYRCPKCDTETEELTQRISAVRDTIPCSNCGTESPKTIAAHGSYKIKGDNSSSTPKKFRG